MKKEIWKDIEGYEGLYQVSNLGKIKALPRKTGFTYNKKERIIKQYKNRKGYYITQLSKNGVPKTIIVHRIVAKTFVINQNNKAQVNHINCNKEDNRAENLEWVTNDENKKHAKEHGLCKSLKGGENPRAKSVNQYDLKGNFIKKWECLSDVARYLKIKNPADICACCKNKVIKDKNGKEYYRKTAYGFIWKYD